MSAPSIEPVACSLPEAQQRARSAALRDGLVHEVRETRELPDGLAVRFPLDAEAEVRAFAAFERGCCSFARFELRRDEPGRALWLEIHGPEGTREFWQGLLPDPGSQEPAARRDDRALRLGLRAGIAALAAALGCVGLCSTPALALVLGALGAGAATASAAAWLDGVAVALLLVAATLLAWTWRRRRRAAAPSCGC